MEKLVENQDGAFVLTFIRTNMVHKRGLVPEVGRPEIDLNKK
jgi:hypothetical protein